MENELVAHGGKGSRCRTATAGLPQRPGLGEAELQQRGCNRRGPRHWFRITGLPGWKRAQLGMPAFGDPRCVPQSHPRFLRRFMEAMCRLVGRRKGAPADLPTPAIPNRVNS